MIGTACDVKAEAAFRCFMKAGFNACSLSKHGNGHFVEDPQKCLRRKGKRRSMANIRPFLAALPHASVAPIAAPAPAESPAAWPYTLFHFTILYICSNL